MTNSVIQTLPIEPVYAEILMRAYGIGIPELREPDSESRYLSECEKNGVTPFSEIKLTYDAKRRTFILSYPDGKNAAVDELSREEKKKENIVPLHDGKKIHRIRIEINSLACRGNSAPFQEFRNEFLGKIVNEGYQIACASIWFSSVHYGRSGYSPLSTLHISENAIGLNLAEHDARLSKDNKDKITLWYSSLGERTKFALKKS
ncbi:MAG TPA: hypothetical protein VI894_01645 [Candidatus Nanoarchaeia archaeon]|nr:hypothetical protein [Candidatus Nanoarchaeia archaeon]